MSERTLKDIIKDHVSGEASASSLRERTRKESQPQNDRPKVEELDDEAVSKSEETQRMMPQSEVVAAPQVKVVDGKVVLIQESIAIHADTPDNSSYTRVFETHRRLTAATYSKRIKATKWTPAETDVFFRAIAMYGTDFTFVSQLLPRRSRKEVRNKFKREQTANKARIDEAMTSRTPMDFDEFEAALERVKKEAAATTVKKDPELVEDDNNEEEEEEVVATNNPASHTRQREYVEVNSDNEEIGQVKREEEPLDASLLEEEGVDISVAELEADLGWATENEGDT